MSREILKKGLICGAFIAILSIIKHKLEYYYQNELSFSFGTSIALYLIQFSIPIILAYTLWKSLRKVNFFQKFFYGTIAFTFSGLLVLSTNVILHQYIDQNYRNIYTHKTIEKAKENIELYPSMYSTLSANEKNLSALKETTLNSFETKNQIYSFLNIFPYIILLGLVISLSIFSSKQENILSKTSGA